MHLLVQIINNKLYGFIDWICLVQEVLCNQANTPSLNAICWPVLTSCAVTVVVKMDLLSQNKQHPDVGRLMTKCKQFEGETS
jgi:hypothetical protein